MNRHCKGSISVFFSLIFFFIISFFGALFLMSRYRQMETGLKKDLDAAGFSVLAAYEKDWVQEYGLYMVPKSKIETSIKFYLQQNGQHGWGKYTVDTITLAQVQSLQEPEVLQKQINSFMKERGFLDFLEEMLEMLGEIQEKEEVTEDVQWKEIAELEAIQSLYGQLVTNLEGIRSDGRENPYCINHMLEDEPSYEEVIEVLKVKKPSSKQAGVIEKAYGELLQTAELCEESVLTAEALKEAIGKLENPESIPITEAELECYQPIWQKDAQICREAAEILEIWIQNIEKLEEENVVDEKMLQKVKALEHYDRSVYLPYEYKKAEKTWDFTSILERLKGYTVDVEKIAPDKDLDLELTGENREESGEIADVTLDESFESTFLLTEYCLGVFQSFRGAIMASEGQESLNLRGDPIQNRFFNNEIEYLITGKANEYENVDGTRERIILVRMLMNMTYLLVDTEKRTEIETLAQATGGILLPGIGNAIAFTAILTIWSTGEAIVDYSTLIEGGKIPLWKDDDSWQTDLLSVMESKVGEGTVEEKGLSYDQYIRLLLYTVDQEQLLGRIQDLLYLNHQKMSLEEAVTGFSVEGEAISGETAMALAGEYSYEVFQDP